MQPPRIPTQLADRAGDPQGRAPELGKPAVLARGTVRWLCAGCLALIIYGTLGPLGQGTGPWLTAVSDWRWIPPQVRSDRNDVITNVLVYVPVGLALRLLVRRRGRAGAPDLLAGLTLAILLSYLTEVLQQFMPGRSSNLTDVYVNSFAALVGCLLAPLAQRTLRRLHEYAFFHVHLREGTYTVLGWVAVIVAFVLMTWPWELKRPQFTFGFDQPLRFGDPLRFGRFAAFTVVGYFLAGTSIMYGRGRGAAARGAVWRVLLFVLALELAQMVLGEHVSSLLHVLVATVGSMTGALVAWLFVRPRPRVAGGVQGLGVALTPVQRPGYPPALTRSQRVLLTLVLAGTALLSFGLVVLPDAARGALRTAPLFQWAPFTGHYGASFLVVVLDVLQQCALFAFLTLVCLYLTQGRRPVAALLLLLGLVGTIEVSQAFLEGHAGDTTGFILAAFTWVIATRTWQSLYPRPPADGIAPSYVVSQELRGPAQAVPPRAARGR